MANDVMTKYDRSTVGNFVRLARTEFAHIANQAALDGYKAYGIVNMYKWLATLDEKICPICGQLDGEVFEADEAEAGANVPPSHPNCRCTVASYFPPDEIDEMFDKAKRLAKDPETGNTYYVDADLSFTEWYKRLTETQKGEFRYIRKDDVENVPDGGTIDTEGAAMSKPIEYKPLTCVDIDELQRQSDGVYRNKLTKGSRWTEKLLWTAILTVGT